MRIEAKAFNAAAKHLFRHLHEPHALRGNPLVKRFFEHGASQDDALERIHQLVRQGAERCRDADAAAGKDERAQRLYAIVALQCLGKRPIRDVASTLAISVQHCYRERAEACRRVARYVGEYEPSALDFLPGFDEFEFLLDRAAHRTALGEFDAALIECDELVRIASSPHQRIQALHASAFALLEAGRLEDAERAAVAAGRLCVEIPRSEAPSSHAIARACVDLLHAKLAHHTGDAAESGRIAERAMQRLQPVRAAGDYARKLYVDSLYAIGAARCNLGDLEGGYDFIAAAESALRHLRIAPLPLQTHIAVTAWRLRNHLLMSSKSWFPSQQRLDGLASAFERAYAAGLFAEAAGALVALTEYHSFVGNDDETLRAGRFAVALTAKHPSESVKMQTAARVAMMLLTTRYWDQALSLLPGITQPNACDVYDRELIEHLLAEGAFRRRSFARARTLAIGGDRRREYAMLSVGRRLLGAAAAHELSRTREARALIEDTIPTAERLGSAPVLRDAYTVGATITGDPRLRGQAREVARLLSA